MPAGARHAHRPQLALCTIELRVVDCKWQLRLVAASITTTAIAAIPSGFTHAQSVVKVSRVHECALVRRTRTQLRAGAHRARCGPPSLTHTH